MARSSNTTAVGVSVERLNIRRAVAIVILMLSMTAVLFGELKKPDFSGRWELDPAKSQLRPMTKWDNLVLAVEHQEPRLNISMTTKYSDGADFTRRLPLTTDGKEVSMDSKGKGPRIYRASWAGVRLVIKWNEGGATTETWILSPDAKTMTINGSTTSADGKSETWKYVMVKKGA